YSTTNVGKDALDWKPTQPPPREEYLTEDCMNSSPLIYIVLQSRDRRPRLSACKSLNNIPLGYIPSFGWA
ncbi:hypothetical protein, partial [Prevotella veroralis]|uniref:hypothetical protein n=1 Tax=Prevotella veroralis TaxID=28137 RepID=UPI001EE2CC5A